MKRKRNPKFRFYIVESTNSSNWHLEGDKIVEKELSLLVKSLCQRDFSKESLQPYDRKRNQYLNFKTDASPPISFNKNLEFKSALNLVLP